MNIEEQLEIVESNIAEYGVCDITVEEYRYLKQKIRAEVIEDVASEILNLPTKYIDNFDYVSVALILNKLEQLKENK